MDNQYATTEPDEIKPKKSTTPIRDKTRGCQGLINIEASGMTEKIRRTELKQLQEYFFDENLKSCQKIVNSASRFECKKCKKLYEVEIFMEHLLNSFENEQSVEFSSPEKIENIDNLLEVLF